MEHEDQGSVTSPQPSAARVSPMSSDAERAAMIVRADAGEELTEDEWDVVLDPTIEDTVSTVREALKEIVAECIGGDLDPANTGDRIERIKEAALVALNALPADPDAPSESPEPTEDEPF